MGQLSAIVSSPARKRINQYRSRLIGTFLLGDFSAARVERPKLELHAVIVEPVNSILAYLLRALNRELMLSGVPLPFVAGVAHQAHIAWGG